MDDALYLHVLCADISCTPIDPPSCLRLEHRELAVHEHVPIAREPQAKVAFQIGDVAAAQDLPGPLLATPIGELFELSIPADQVGRDCRRRSGGSGTLLAPQLGAPRVKTDGATQRRP